MNHASHSRKFISPILGHIAVVGRPNVGKSTLFNSLLGQRRAITAPEYGVTRDVITEQTSFQGFEVLFSDTGGIRADWQEPIQPKRRRAQASDTLPFVGQLNERVQQRSLSMLEQADLLLWVLALGEFTAEDWQLFDQLQSMRQKVILVINKVDTPEKETEAYNFYEYGFPQLVMVSALHRRGLAGLQAECIAFLQRAHRKPNATSCSRGQNNTAPNNPQANESNVRFTLIGKPNTGKSTLYNRLLGTEASLVSDMPGTTRDVLLQRFSRRNQVYELTDTAGIRRKSKVQENVEYYSVNRAIKNLDKVDIAVLMIDSREGILQQDKKIAQQVIKRGRGLIFALNKIDLLENPRQAIHELEKDTRDLFPHLHYAPICSISASSGRGTQALLSAIDRVYEQLNKRIGTGLLNQVLQDWIRYYPPPNNGTNRFKIRYLTQVEVNPLRFILFVNRSKDFPQSYLGFLQNQLRTELSFMDVPLHLHLRE